MSRHILSDQASRRTQAYESVGTRLGRPGVFHLGLPIRRSLLRQSVKRDWRVQQFECIV
jgi:hypothetical protein